MRCNTTLFAVLVLIVSFRYSGASAGTIITAGGGSVSAWGHDGSANGKTYGQSFNPPYSPYRFVDVENTA